jgi:hypothetical protein
MEIDETLCVVVKPQGATTPAAIIPFEDLITYGVIFSSEVDTGTAISATSAWLQGGQVSGFALDLLHSVIVDFGEGHRIWGRFSAYYAADIEAVNEHLIAAFGAPDRIAAQAHLRKIRGLGGEAYSTKMLRFINPDYVVCDSVLRAELCGQMPYEQFLDDCRFVAAHIGESAVFVESSLYAYVQVAKPGQRKHRWRQYQQA